MRKIVFILSAIFVFISAVSVVGNYTKMYVQTTPPYVGFGSFEENYVGVDEISYKGENGKDALSLLKNHARVEQEMSGLVVAINDRKADPTKKEFWAFYVNGKLADKGPADYVTSTNDLIEWKIETY